MSSTRFPAQLLGVPTVPYQLTATSSSQSQTLSSSCRMISIRARTSNCRYVIGRGTQTANASTSHFIAVDERIDVMMPACDGCQIGYIRDSAATTNGTLEITELA